MLSGPGLLLSLSENYKGHKLYLRRQLKEDQVAPDDIVCFQWHRINNSLANIANLLIRWFYVLPLAAEDFGDYSSQLAASRDSFFAANFMLGRE
jgi:hypothetical protein